MIAKHVLNLKFRICKKLNIIQQRCIENPGEGLTDTGSIANYRIM